MVDTQKLYRDSSIETSYTVYMVAETAGGIKGFKPIKLIKELTDCSQKDVISTAGNGLVIKYNKDTNPIDIKIS